MAERAPHGAGPRQSRDGDAPRAARPAKAGAKPSFKRQARQDVQGGRLVGVGQEQAGLARVFGQEGNAAAVGC